MVFIIEASIVPDAADDDMCLLHIMYVQHSYLKCSKLIITTAFIQTVVLYDSVSVYYQSPRIDW